MVGAGRDLGHGMRDSIIYQALRRQGWWIVLLAVLTMTSLGITGAVVATIKSVFDDAIIAHTKPLDDLVDTLVYLALAAFAVGLPLRMVGARVVYQLEFDM